MNSINNGNRMATVTNALQRCDLFRPRKHLTLEGYKQMKRKEHWQKVQKPNVTWKRVNRIDNEEYPFIVTLSWLTLEESFDSLRRKKLFWSDKISSSTRSIYFFTSQIFLIDMIRYQTVELVRCAMVWWTGQMNERRSTIGERQSVRSPAKTIDKDTGANRRRRRCRCP
ncbi:hypothetical protein DICVIV_11273 [Dictyocaulus viviparus]|uniref:Uncharacterized protein n=1 Tax=Dictyocaulus viviparus TaxID=29172 RepID=A0A0D8XG77_DICVI|nr:hypothetical protein DICVIV_11273 [Dictyocaulus viviparus]